MHFLERTVHMELILASQSPRRRELLGLFHIPFSVRAADIDETMTAAAGPETEVARVSREKAMAVSAPEDGVVIAADTIVVLDGAILGKPRSEEEAAEMLRSLSGRTHQVMTGVTVKAGDRLETLTETTAVTFRSLSLREIQDYVRTGEPMDKAGSYGIQGGGALFVESILGDYYNVMGLPVCRLWQMLERLAPALLEERT